MKNLFEIMENPNSANAPETNESAGETQASPAEIKPLLRDPRKLKPQIKKAVVKQMRELINKAPRKIRIKGVSGWLEGVFFDDNGNSADASKQEVTGDSVSYPSIIVPAAKIAEIKAHLESAGFPGKIEILD